MNIKKIVISAIGTNLIISSILCNQPKQSNWLEVPINTLPNNIVHIKQIITATNDIDLMETIMNKTTKKSINNKESYYLSEIPLSKELQKYLYNTCNKYKVNYNEALAIISVESNYNVNAIHKNNNSTIDIGLFQINSSNYKNLRETLNIKNLKNPYDNIKAGVYILSKLQSLNQHQRYIAYNQGVGGMKRTISRGIYTTEYSRKVIREISNIKKMKNYKEKDKNNKK